MIAERDAEHRKMMGEWQAASESKHREEIDRIQNMLMTELREMQEKYFAVQVIAFIDDDIYLYSIFILLMP